MLFATPLLCDFSEDGPEDCVMVIGCANRSVVSQYVTPLLKQRLLHHLLGGVGQPYESPPVPD